MESNEEMKIGLYYIRDSYAKGRITSFMEYPEDLYALMAFKKFLETEQAKQFPIPKKLELKRLCLVGQVTDSAYLDSLNKTICNAANVDEVISIRKKAFEKE